MSKSTNNKKPQRSLPALALIAGTTAIVAGWVWWQNSDTEMGQSESHSSSTASEVYELLASLTVAERDPNINYSREQFGERWADIDGNGCNQRQDILQRDLDNIELDSRNGCVVRSGILNDPFSGETINFKHGKNTSEAVQIDHVVALNDAWQKGAQHWTFEKREQFANDPLNLLAVSGDLNDDKGSSDASYWLPPNKAFHCTYVSTQIRVKAHYNIWITRYEKEAFEQTLAKC